VATDVWRSVEGITWSSWVHSKFYKKQNQKTTKVLRRCKIYHDITKPRVGNGFDHQAHWKPKQTTWPTFYLAFEHPG